MLPLRTACERREFLRTENSPINHQDAKNTKEKIERKKRRKTKAHGSPAV
jgi:predicted RecB family nuclease